MTYIIRSGETRLMLVEQLPELPIACDGEAVYCTLIPSESSS
ncbi:hypothetical protein [Nitrososphaera sp. AFS]|nr:hypothetical protein [Nitrososphaera sp. AFS]